jgi:adenylate cyclase
LNANYVVTGKYAQIARGSIGDQLLITCELIDTKHGHVIWSERFHGSVTDLLSLESETADRLAQSCHAALSRHEIEKAWIAPLETLAAYSLQMSGVYLLHSSNLRDFNKSSLILTALTERCSRLAEPLAWIGKWHVLRVIRGLSDDPQRDAQSALSACNSALARFPDLAAAHAIKGYVLSQNFSDSEASLKALDQALKLAPNDAQGWLYKSVWSQHWGDTGQAVNDALRARTLSPLDPVGHFFDAVLCSALAFDRQYASAIEIAQRCLRLDRNHAPSLRTIVLSQVESGDMLGAKTTARRLRLVSPNLSLESYKALGNANSQARLRVYEALKAVGF